MTSYSLIEVQLSDIEDLRLIRNQCRDFMTRNNNVITAEEQKKWYNSIDKNKLIPYLFLQDTDKIGYGIIRIESDYCLLTGGLIENFRNKGLGYNLFNSLCLESNKLKKDIKLEVLKTNTRAFKLYEKMGFVVTAESDSLYFMKRENES
jgi:GNAT superfamily N-acetyltransferase